MFDLFDEDKTGMISAANLKSLSMYLGDSKNPEEVEEILLKAAADGK